MYRAVDQTLNVKVVDFAVVDRLIEDPDRQLIVRHLVPYNADAAAAVGYPPLVIRIGWFALCLPR